MNDNSLAIYWIACVAAGALMTFALFVMKPPKARAQTQPAIHSITIELKRDRRRFPKFMKLKQPRENGNAAAQVQSGHRYGSSYD